MGSSSPGCTEDQKLDGIGAAPVVLLPEAWLRGCFQIDLPFLGSIMALVAGVAKWKS
jgi:hypothetical protein